MPEYIVRIKHEQTRYADVRIQADTVPEAADEISCISCGDDGDCLVDGPGDWDVEHSELSVELITDEDGNTFSDEDKMLAAWEAAQDHEAV